MHEPATKPIMPKLPGPARLLHGGDYNPDQWLDSPDVLAQDIELMKKAGVNCVSLGIFAWAKLEPEESRYDLDWMAAIIDNLYDNGIYTILATPSGAKPNWLAHRYTEVCRVNRDGQRELPGERHNHCFTSPVYREKTRAINTVLAKRFADHPGVILWHLSNEYNGECYCSQCVDAFRLWLREKYGTMEKLNHQWWSAFWSHTITDWNQIYPPVPYGEKNVHALTLDWKRFVTHQTVDFMRQEIDALRAVCPDMPVTTNLMGFYPGLNYFKFKDDLDIVSWDNYPQWHTGDDVETAMVTAMAHDLMRSIKGEPFLLMESTPSMTNWQPFSKLKRPGMHMLSSMQAIAHGSNSVQYFQWRKSRGSSEKFHGAVVDHCGHGNTRVFRDVAELGSRMADLGFVADTAVRPDVAILYDWENRWAIDNARGPRNSGMHYVETVTDHYRPLWEMGINADIVDMECDLSRYKLVIAPMLYMYRAGIEQKLKDFVSGGGTLVGTYWSGVVNENDLCFLGGFPGGGMDEVFGIWAEEIDSLPDGQTNALVLESDRSVRYPVSELCELIHTRGAQVYATYERDFYAGMPVVTQNSYGNGEAWYLAAKADPAFLREFYRKLALARGITMAIDADLPHGVVASLRKGTSDLVFLQNYNNQDAIIMLPTTMKNMETGEAERTPVLGPYELMILEL
ncbi:beta-galactosidase [Ruminococcaceae bacterium OttesenSCG-928-L11]|nr:beta-galactosidase [Ruminococcaceae bacterium OttesenSCG-928-L11]